MKQMRATSLLLSLVLASGCLFGQDVGEQLKKLGTENAPGYLGPLMSGWGAGLNAGLFHSADLHDILGFDVQVKATLAGLDDADKKYMFQSPATIGTFVRGTDYPAQIEASTVVGPKDVTLLKHTNGTTLMTLPGGLDIPSAPLIVPQVSIGLPFGLEVMGRFIPTTKLGDAGKVNFTGFGLRHDIDQYLPLFPIDIAVHFVTQKFNYEDGSGQKLISASATAFGVEASKKLLLLTLYTGFQIESSSWDIGPYNATVSTVAGNQTITVPQFTIEGKNKSRLLIGARILLAIINVHADYSLATTSTISVGAGISFR